MHKTFSTDALFQELYPALEKLAVEYDVESVTYAFAMLWSDPAEQLILGECDSLTEYLEVAIANRIKQGLPSDRVLFEDDCPDEWRGSDLDFCCEMFEDFYPNVPALRQESESLLLRSSIAQILKGRSSDDFEHLFDGIACLPGARRTLESIYGCASPGELLLKLAPLIDYQRQLDNERKTEIRKREHARKLEDDAFDRAQYRMMAEKLRNISDSF
jgi:hypothetical protein